MTASFGGGSRPQPIMQEPEFKLKKRSEMSILKNSVAASLSGPHVESSTSFIGFSPVRNNEAE